MATEQEFKFFLTRDQMAGLERRVRREREPEERLQVNYYYDTEDGLLRRREITLRARLTETYLELQYKRRLPQEGGFRRHEEWSRPLGQTLPGKLRLCAEADGRGEKVLCVLQGALVTRRRRFRFSEGLQLDLDTNLYLGVCDWEAELEFCPGTEPGSPLSARLAGAGGGPAVRAGQGGTIFSPSGGRGRRDLCAGRTMGRARRRPVTAADKEERRNEYQ